MNGAENPSADVLQADACDFAELHENLSLDIVLDDEKKSSQSRCRYGSFRPSNLHKFFEA